MNEDPSVPPPQTAPDEVSRLERVREELYAPQATPTFELPSLSTRPTDNPAGWKDETPSKEPLSWAVKFLIVAIIFFVFAGGVTAALLIHGGRSISADRIDILVQGPTTIASGDTVPLLVTIKNNNPTTITDTNFTMDLPPGTRDAASTSTPLDHYTDTLGTLIPGASVTRTVTAVMFGAENQKLSIPMHLEYRTSASNAVFLKDKDYALTVSTSPISVQVSTVGQSASGQPITVAVRVRSNAATPLQNVALLGQYPTGFTATASNPTASANMTFFALGTLAPGEEKDVTVTGTLSGIQGDASAFNFTVGTAAAAGKPVLDISYTSGQSTVAVTKPLVGVTLALNHDSNSSTIIAKAGQTIDGLVVWVNTLSDTITNAQVVIHFSGSAFDQSGVQTSNGFYRSSDASLIYSGQTNPGLASFQSGNTGNGSFTLISLPASSLRGVRDPSIVATVSVSGTRSNGSATNVSTSLTRTIQIATDLSLSARAYHTGGPFSNTGPLPPRANMETDYTINLTANSSVSSVVGGVTTLTLPSYVRFTGQASPADTSITYDDTTRTVSWHMAHVDPGVPLTASFQVAFLPSISQKDQQAILASGISVSGTDQFTKQQVTADADDITTDIRTDSAYRLGYDKVGQ